jgi:DNA-binding NtrC family response regulator
VEKFSVLIVDDEVGPRNAIGRTLRREGYELYFASGGAEALEIIEQGNIDLVLTDNRMPGMTGLELVKKVREAHPEVVRIIITGYADLDTVREAINEAEVYRFLIKPWDDDDLRLTLRAAAERRRLERENRRLLATVRRHEEILAELEKQQPGITKVDRDETGAIIIPDED